MAMNELSDFDAVSDEPLERQFPSSILAGSAQGLARATLVPLHHREVPLPRPDDRREDAAGRSRAAVDHEQDRVVSILAANPDPLVDAADSYEALLGDPVVAANPQCGSGSALAQLSMK
jgi:hypothetical protein